MTLLGCVPLPKRARAYRGLLSSTEELILKFHCCERQSFTRIAGDFGVALDEVEQAHDEACNRLAMELIRRLADEG